MPLITVGHCVSRDVTRCDKGTPGCHRMSIAGTLVIVNWVIIIVFYFSWAAPCPRAAGGIRTDALGLTADACSISAFYNAKASIYILVIVDRSMDCMASFQVFWSQGEDKLIIKARRHGPLGTFSGRSLLQIKEQRQDRGRAGSKPRGSGFPFSPARPRARKTAHLVLSAFARGRTALRREAQDERATDARLG